MKTLSVATLTVVIIVLSGPRTAAAEPYVTGTYQLLQRGYFVELVFYNALEQETISRWSVTSLGAANPESPDGWRAYKAVRNVDWSVVDAFYEIQPHRSLGGFGFILQSPPGTLEWGIGGSGWGGYVTPVPIPEPSSLSTLALALAGVGVGVLRRRR